MSKFRTLSSHLEYLRLEKFKAASRPSFVEHLLALPKDDVEFERLPFITREVEF